MSKYIFDIYNKIHEGHIDRKTKRIIDVLYKDMVETGTRVMLEGEEIYTKKFKFRTDGDCMFDDDFDEPIDDVDFAKLSDEKLWAYIFGEYFLNGRIYGLNGFGATQVETF
jgi:hypothetical protein